jgi:hypothetical protein
MMDSITKLLAQFIGAVPASAASRILSSIEAHPVPLHSQSDRRKGGQFGAKLKRLQPYNHQLPCGTIYRQAFLWGVANYLRGLPHEELVIGFGVAEGARTRIESAMKIRGDAESVSLSPSLAAVVHSFLSAHERHTVILIHNHPDQHPVLVLLTTLFGPEPLPSLTDREFGLKSLILRLRSKASGQAFGRMRFFVVQNDALKEFSGITPALLIDLAVSVLKGQEATFNNTEARNKESRTA